MCTSFGSELGCANTSLRSGLSAGIPAATYFVALVSSDISNSFVAFVSPTVPAKLQKILQRWVARPSVFEEALKYTCTEPVRRNRYRFCRISYSWYWFWTKSVPAHSCFRRPFALHSNGNQNMKTCTKSHRARLMIGLARPGWCSRRARQASPRSFCCRTFRIDESGGKPPHSLMVLGGAGVEMLRRDAQRGLRCANREIGVPRARGPRVAAHESRFTNHSSRLTDRHSQITQFLIGSTAIRNRRNQMKTNGRLPF